jgi:cytochrome c oxidase accessory protein FixG
VIGYDAKRGEPRGKPVPAAPVQEFLREVSSEASPGTGDCVACNRCVNVCPAGIDIRHGLQMECIGCTACIDACDDVMTRLDRPRGLIRYDSQAAFSGGRTQWLRPRTVLYAVLLLIGASVTGWSLSTVKPANLGVTRMTGAPYIVDETSVRNQFLIRVVNKRDVPLRFSLRVTGAPEGLRQNGFETAVEVAPLTELVQPLVLQVSRAHYEGPFRFGIRLEDGDGTFWLVREAEFVGPEARLLREEKLSKQTKGNAGE